MTPSSYPTPRTDAAAFSPLIASHDGFSAAPKTYALAEDMRQLERELAHANAMLKVASARLHWLHDCSTGQIDPEGYEWGIYRVKWKDGNAISVRQTNSDFSDLDAEMARELSAMKGTQ